MLQFLLLGIVIYANVQLAKKKGQNPLVWGLITFFAFFAAFLLLGTIYILMIYRGPVTREAMQAYLENSPLTMLMLEMLGVGGVLIVRYILERKSPENKA